MLVRVYVRMCGQIVCKKDRDSVTVVLRQCDVQELASSGFNQTVRVMQRQCYHFIH